MALPVKDLSTYKDACLDALAETVNVAQFVSFGPGRPRQRFARIRSHTANARFSSVEGAVDALLRASNSRSVNVRSFRPDQPGRQPFFYGLTDIESASAHVQHLAADGLFTIVNETIDVEDGGVSGVSYGGILEFAPDDTPRCVETREVAALPWGLGTRLLSIVYGFSPALDYPPARRVEFSIHPMRQGLRSEHTILWEIDPRDDIRLIREITWPNRFSRFLGDKLYGLLVAEVVGAPVPATTAIARRVAPFRFGREIGTRETWIRTAPDERDPGRFPTELGWRDPFEMLANEREDAERIRAILAQESVERVYSGNFALQADGTPKIEGVQGRGDLHQKGRMAPQVLPVDTRNAVMTTYEALQKALGDVFFEWVYDGSTAWVVQLHRGRTAALGQTIFPGQPKHFHRFDVRRGLDALRELVTSIDNRHEGVILVGDVGSTSHLGGLLQDFRVPSRIEPGNTIP